MRDAAHQFHDEVGPAGVGRAGVEHLGDVRMIHHGQRLPLGLEAGDDLLGVHAQLDDLERDAPAHRLLLLGHIDHAAAAFADFLQQLVAAERLAHGFVGRIGEVELDRGTGSFGLCGEQRLGLFVRGEQGFEALAQGGVAVAVGVEKRGRASAAGLPSASANRASSRLGFMAACISVFSFASAAAISSQDGARQACHGAPARITSPSALHLAASRSEPVPPKVSSSCRVPTSQSLTASRPPDAEINRRPSGEKAMPKAAFRWPWMVFDQLALGGIKQPHLTTIGGRSHQSAIGRNRQ